MRVRLICDHDRERCCDDCRPGFLAEMREVAALIDFMYGGPPIAEDVADA